MLGGRQDANGVKISGWQDPNGLMVKWRARCKVFDVWGIGWEFYKCSKMYVVWKKGSKESMQNAVAGKVSCKVQWTK